MFKFKEEDLLPVASIDDVNRLNHYDLFRHYIGEFKIGVPILSPLEKESVPSFSIFISEGKVLYNDFRLGGGDIISFVGKMYSLDVRGSINKIIYDSGLGDQFNTNFSHAIRGVVSHNKKIVDTKVQVGVKRRVWRSYDTLFWSQYGISKDVLRKYKVAAISHVFFNGKPIKSEKYAYCFQEMKDGRETLTVYQPNSVTRKWHKSHDSSVFYGWTQLPYKGEMLIITKSLKDVMTIDALTGIPVVALQNEKIKPKVQVIDELKSRFERIYLLYDNDFDNEGEGKVNYGREFGGKIADEFGLTQLEIPDEIAIKYKAKDISDLVKHADEDIAGAMLMREINGK